MIHVQSTWQPAGFVPLLNPFYAMSPVIERLSVEMARPHKATYGPAASERLDF